MRLKNPPQAQIREHPKRLRWGGRFSIAQQFAISFLLLSLIFLGFSRYNLIRFQQLERHLVLLAGETIPVLQVAQELVNLLGQTQQVFRDAVEEEDADAFLDVDAVAATFLDEIRLMQFLLPGDPAVAEVERSYTLYIELGKRAVTQFLREGDLGALGDTMGHLDRLTHKLGEMLETKRRGAEVAVNTIMAEAQRTGALIRQMMFFGTVMAFIIAGMSAWLIRKRITQPIKRLADAAVRIGQEDFSTRVEVRQADELGDLGGALNRMTGDLQQSHAELVAARDRLEKLLSVKDELIAKVSHELRTPMTSIKEGLELLIDNALGETTPDQQDFLNTMNNDVDRLTELVTNLLDASKLEAGRMQLNRRKVEANQLVDEIIASYRALMGNRHVVIKRLENSPVFVDANRMHQVFGNFISNAVKFTRDNGTITFLVKQKDGNVGIAIKDNGVGIAADDLPKLFQKFSQVGERDPNQPKGTGLGLVVCKEFVELHKGRVEISSELGHGSNFTVWLPRHTDALALTESFEALKDLAREQDKAVGFIAVRADPTDCEGESSSAQPAKLVSLAESIRKQIHHRDVVLEMPAPWIIVLAMIDADGVPSMVKRMAGRSWENARLRFGVAIYPNDGSDPMKLYALAQQSLGQEPTS